MSAPVGSVATPYVTMPTPELVAVRRWLTAMFYATDGTEEEREAVGELVIGTTIELAERLTAIVDLADAGDLALGLETLAYDVGGVPPPRSRPGPPPASRHDGDHRPAWFSWRGLWLREV